MRNFKTGASGDGTGNSLMEIPYERQLESPTRRTCGAAALCMAYRSLGIRQSQDMIWEQISQADASGRRVARTYLLARNALHHGLAALVLRAQPSRDAFTRWLDAGVRIILNHRLQADAPWGHYSVLVATEPAAVTVHDPQLGPDRRLAWPELLALWEPLPGGSEIGGRILVAVARRHAGAPLAAGCSSCGTALPREVTCPRCRSRIPLEPQAVLGCAAAACLQRTWETLFCPYCDLACTTLP